MHAFFQDLRFAFRVLAKQPGFTLVAVLTLALGIGANTAMFSIVNAVLLRPLPYPGADRIVTVNEADKNNPITSTFALSLPNYLDWKRDSTVFENLAVTRPDSINLSDIPGRDPERIAGAYVSANFFDVFGMKPQLGRVFTADEDKSGGSYLAVISDRLWHRAFQGDASVLGRAANFQGRSITIIGVMPPGMGAPQDTDVWLPFMPRAANIPAWQQRVIHPMLSGWARLKAGVPLAQAQTEMKAIAARLEQQFPESNAGSTAIVMPMLENMVGQYRSNLALLLGAVALVLLVACANLASLFAARNAGRAREFAIRAAIGAQRGQITRQLAIESLLIASIGGLAGFLLALWGRDLMSLLAPPGITRFHDVAFGWPVLAFSLGLAVVTSVLFGVWPAWQSSRADVQLALKVGGPGSSDTTSVRRTRDWLVIADVALTLVLLSSAGLVVKSFSRLQSLGLGYEPRNLFSARLDLPYVTYSKPGAINNFAQTLMDKVGALPGVSHVTVAANAPLQQAWQAPFLREGAPEPAPGQEPSAETSALTGDYFGTLGASLLRGRTFDARDNETAPLVVIIDQTLADRYFPNEDPIGKRLRTDAGESPDVNLRWYEIIGVAPRMKFHGPDATQAMPVIYFSEAQARRTNLTLMIRTKGSPATLEKPIREIVTAIDPHQPLHDVRTMSDRVAETWATQRLLTFLLSVFAGLALLLATIGLYGVLAYNAARRVREIGLRLALGATRSHIRALLVSHGARLLLIGGGLGVVGAIGAASILRSVLFQFSLAEPGVYLAVALLLGAATAIASLLPAIRASRIDPMVALREE